MRSMTDDEKAALRASYRARILAGATGEMFAPAFIAEAFPGYDEMQTLLGDIVKDAARWEPPGAPLIDPKLIERAQKLTGPELPPPWSRLPAQHQAARGRQLRAAIRRYPSGYQMATELIVEAFAPLQALADLLAGMTTDAEQGGDMSGDDAATTLSQVIFAARDLSDARPPARPLDPDLFVFKIREPDPACSECKGTGEVVDYPPDDDERLIACGRCGGTGEGIRS